MDPRAPRDQLRDSSAAQEEMAKVVRRRIYVEVFAGDVLEGAARAHQPSKPSWVVAERTP